MLTYAYESGGWIGEKLNDIKHLADFNPIYD